MIPSSDVTEAFVAQFLTELTSGEVAGPDSPHWGEPGVISVVTEQFYEQTRSFLVTTFLLDASRNVEQCFLCRPWAHETDDLSVLLWVEDGVRLRRLLADDEQRQMGAVLMRPLAAYQNNG